MADSAELKTLHHAIDDLSTAVKSVQGAYGDVPAVARLRNDVERIALDVSDVEALPPAPPAKAVPMHQVSDEPYDPALWSEDADDEGLGGYHGTGR
jgi:hypothetical protein